MIFVTVGNWHKGFDRLIKSVHQLIIDGLIQEQVIMQIGSGSFHPEDCTVFDYCSPEQCETYIKNCRVVISHAGMGTISTAIRFGKPVIIIPRQKSLGEIYDDHQFITARKLVEEGKALVAYDVEQIPEMLQRAETFVPQKSETSRELLDAVRTYLEQLQSKINDK